MIVVAAAVAALASFAAPVFRYTTAAQAPAAGTNVLVSPWAGPYGGVPPWDHARPENFPAALQAALDAQRREIAAIAGDTSAPTFENTMVAMQRSGQVFDRVVRMFSVVRDNMSTPEFQKVEREWTPKLAAAADEIAFNPGLLARVEAVYRSLGTSKLTAEQKRLVTRTYEGFVRSGAKLDAAQKKRMSEINQELAGSFTDFSSKVLADENTWTVIDVRAFEVTDTPSGRHRGLFYLDNFARQGKRSGAWAFSYRSQHRLGQGSTAITSNNNNFVKGAPGQPVLISLDDAITLFHEFGHALHALLTDITYPGFGATPRDFVEYPSQVNERWLLERETLDRFAKHFKTGEPMPQALVDKVKQSEKFNQGYATVEYLAAAIVDMELHVRPDGVVDAAAFERESLARIGMPREIGLRHRLPQFLHLFSSDSYSAGYYSYLWSDVMAADTWQAFVEAGGAWDKKVADRLRRHILADGNTIDRAEAYRLFSGRDPDVKALLEKRGFPTN